MPQEAKGADTSPVVRVARVVGHKIEDESAPLARRIGGPTKAIALGSVATVAAVGGGFEGVHEISNFLATNPHLLADYGLYTAAAVGAAALTTGLQMHTRMSSYGDYHPRGYEGDADTRTPAFHDLMRTVKIRSASVAGAAGLAAVGVHLLNLAGTGIVDQGLIYAATAASGVAVSSAIGARRTRGARPVSVVE